MDVEEGFQSEKHPLSGRWAVFQDDGRSAWLFLTARSEPTPMVECWLYNRVPAPTADELQEYRGGPPPVTVDFAGPDAQYMGDSQPQVSFQWSANGEAVAALIDGTALGFVRSDMPRGNGFSRHLLRAGAWGKPWDEAVYRETFASNL